MNKRNYNYIAAVEKAISQKYGKDTVQDFRSDWYEEKEKDYLEQLRLKRIKKQQRKNNREKIEIDDTVINKVSRADRVCPVCKTYSFSPADDLYMNRFDCCQQCYISYVEFREERWQSGWRPSHGEYKPPRFRSFIRAVKRHVGKILRRIKKWLPF
jgi:hypothetical protein